MCLMGVCIECPSNITHFAEIGVEAIPVFWEETFASSLLPWNASHNPGDLFPVGGITEVTYTVNDNGEGNGASCSFTVAVTGP